MIEVEKKFLLTITQEHLLLEGATFLKEKTNEDVYFDTEDFALTRQDHWLRNRSGRYELKRRVHALGHKMGGTAYDELETDEKIRTFLHLATDASLEEDLRLAGYKPFANIITHRRQYERDGFHIDLDACDFGYQIAEIELMLETADERESALARIDAFALQLGLDTTPTRGKIIEYLHRFKPEHFEILVSAGVIRV